MKSKIKGLPLMATAIVLSLVLSACGGNNVNNSSAEEGSGSTSAEDRKSVV